MLNVLRNHKAYYLAAITVHLNAKIKCRNNSGCDSVAIVPHLHTPCPLTFSQSLISLKVSADVKYHVYFKPALRPAKTGETVSHHGNNRC